MRLIDALTQYPAVRVFAVVGGNEAEWDVKPLDVDVLTESEEHECFIIKANQVLPDGTFDGCYIDMCLPERICDYAYFLRGDHLDVRYYHECDGEIICAVPINCFGDYELFYSRTAPDIGIAILRKGLASSSQKGIIAEDLGYILRDERRFAEAADMFQISVDEEPSSYFIYGELANCYDEVGETEKAKHYHALFKTG